MVSIVCPVVAITGLVIFGAADRDQTFVTLVLIGKFSKGIYNDVEIDRNLSATAQHGGED